MRKKGFTSVVVILVAVIVLLAGVVVWQSFSQSDTIEPQNSPSPVAVSIPSDWETYAGSGYSFSYPSDFEQQPYLEGNFKGVSVVGFGPAQKASGRTQTSLFDGLLIKTIVITGADKFVQEVAQDSYQADNDSLDPISVEEGTQDISELVPVTVGGAAGYSYELKSSFSNTKVAFLPLNNGVLKITFFRAGEEPALTGYINQGDQILSTFKLTKNESPKTVALPTPPSTWKSHIFQSPKVTLYTPTDWNSDSKYYSETDSTLFRFWKKQSPDIVPIQLSVKPDWSSMGDTQYFAKNATVGGNIPAIRVDPPKLNEQQLERYQTNVYFEKSGKVYVFDCVHNWKEDYLETCNTMFDTIKFE